jgi:Uma2 family endonuclease
MLEMTAPPKAKTTAEEYFNLPEDYPFIRELIDGEIMMTGSPKYKHQKAVGATHNVLTNLIPNGLAVVAPMTIYFDNYNLLQPDVFWVAEDGSCVEGEDGFLYGAPSLVIEVLSKSTARRDRGIKFDLYEKFGVREYWLVDTDEQFVEVFTLADNGRFVKHVLATAETPFLSPILGKEVSLEKVFA